MAGLGRVEEEVTEVSSIVVVSKLPQANLLRTLRLVNSHDVCSRLAGTLIWT